MACFTVPLAGAAVAGAAHRALGRSRPNPFVARLPWLVKMALGGSFLLAIEHFYHGEIVAHPPFLTAMSNAADTEAMLHEMATVGVSMAVLLTVVWAGMVVVSEAVAKRAGRAVENV
ncbi:MAG: hypothetical protein J6T51_00440 [Kiritimatiellae bacterium]|nr:hypothetical protein [Kiritimatiellia bacterium]